MVQETRSRKGKTMARHIEDQIDYYYDSHSTEEDLMGETVAHAALVHYLVEVLSWLFHGLKCAIYENLNMYLSRNKEEYPLAPHITVIKGFERENLRSWGIPVRGRAPNVVFEIASDETWSQDLKEKPHHYERMKVAEYFAYDPNEPPIVRRHPQRLYGWRRDEETGRLYPMTPGASGELWSEQLESWLVPDGAFLRLYDRSGKLRLTRAEAEASRALAEAKRAEALAEKLRSLGVDPDQLI